MNILLLNNNPVVNKLVTLSAQKTSDNLDLANVVDEIAKDTYDLLVVDDTFYEEGILAQIQEKTSYKKSLLICSRDMPQVPEFDEILKKPFLPTDLVELFSSVSKEVESMQEDTPDETIEEMLILDDFGEDIDLSSPSILDDDEAQEVKELLDETSDGFEEFDEELNLDNIDLDDDLELEDSLELESLETPELEEIPELEDSLESLEEENIEDVEEEVSLDAITDLELEDSMELEAMPELEEASDLEIEETPETEESLESLEEENLDDIDEEEEISLDSITDLELEDSFDLESEVMPEMEETPELEESITLENEDLDIEDQIKTAVSELSPEDLEEEVSEETLLEIAETEINSFDTLNSKDLKLAIGEEVEEEEEETVEEIEEIESPIVPQEEPSLPDMSQDNGVESLKNLLQALTDKNVAASLKGMKISINITLGDN